MRDGLLLLHITGVAGWLGGGMFFVFTSSNLVTADVPGGGRALARIVERSSWFFGLATALILLSGIGLVLDSAAYDWTDTFVLVGIGVIVLSGIWQGLVAGKMDQRMVDAVVSGEPDASGSFRRWRLFSLVDFGLIAIALWAMIVKLGA